MAHGDVRDMIHGGSEGRAVGALEERIKCCGDRAGAAPAQSGRGHILDMVSIRERPAEAVAPYDDGSSSEGMAVFAPGGPETVEQAAKPAPIPPPVSTTAGADCRPTLPSAFASDDHAKLPAERSPADSRIVAGE